VTLTEIRTAVDSGLDVRWGNDLYKVINATTNTENQYLIKCTTNNYMFGLTHKDGVTLNGAEEDFYIKNS